MRTNKVSKEWVSPTSPRKPKLGKGSLPNTGCKGDSQSVQLPLFQFLDTLNTPQQLLSPWHVELLLWCAIFFDIDAERIEEVRGIEEVRLIV